MSSIWHSLSLLAGGLGLFLLGMGMMTDGLKQAAGQALHNILASATRTRWHALGSGALVTAMVQSSTAVTVAAIGFINAGLLGLAPALWVLFGANIGSTMTGWLVALVGLKFKIEAFALPLVGLGMLLRLTGASQRRGAIGTAVAGLVCCSSASVCCRNRSTASRGRSPCPRVMACRPCWRKCSSAC